MNKLKGQKGEKKAFAFPTKVKCPRCGALDTVAYSTKGRTQYRKCRRSVCRKTFSIQGEEVV